MKIVVIGGTGLIGSKTVAILRQRGHEVVAASPNSGVNTITGEGVKQAVAGAQVVIDLANSPSFEDRAVLEFFETAGRNLLPAEAAAGVRHHIALSIVGVDRSDNGYFRGKVAQEKLIEASGIPYTIIRSTQFLEFLQGIADSAAEGTTVRLPPSLFQPIAADDVAANVADVALAAPRNGIVEIAGPERARKLAFLTALIERIDLGANRIDIHLRPTQLGMLLDIAETPSPSATDDETRILSVPIASLRAGDQDADRGDRPVLRQPNPMQG